MKESGAKEVFVKIYIYTMWFSIVVAVCFVLCYCDACCLLL